MKNIPDTEEFRDSIATVDKKGKRIWVYPKKQHGRFYIARTILSIFLLAVLFAAPGIKINGHPFILLNVLERKFIIFGLAFGPQDFYLFVLATITLIIFIVLFTAIYGRLFCGWVCPQTVFMEMVFRKIEYWIEGDAERQRSLDNTPAGGSKIFKKGIKHLIFFSISFLIANTFIAYIIGIDELMKWINDSPFNHTSSFVATIVFTGIFYFVFARFREQACTIVCPYGRLQGVLLDPNSIVVAYDFNRGEPKGIFRKGEERKLGDCIDCKLCVKVCPTGIDIRNGTQLECVNCTSCIDACNSIMKKVNLPVNLIRYDSINGIKGLVKKKFTPRVILYTVILAVLLSVFGILLSLRSDINTSVLRVPGTLFQELPDDKVGNFYNIKVVNNTFDDIRVQLKISNNPDAELKLQEKEIALSPLSKFEGEVQIVIPKDKIKFTNTQLKIDVYTGNNKIEELKTNFLGPNK